MKKQKTRPNTDWTSPAALLESIGKRQLQLATEEENKRHMDLVNQPGTPENTAHQRILARRFRR